ncbi:MAG: glycoside hydrolase family 2 TIM barrel-domain containing protein, partial [Armatimonadota bacterium]|nr:glycoside hydrolase family 2 TIM barrel-domain containing protein [Armatimonadota bacterium]
MLVILGVRMIHVFGRTWIGVLLVCVARVVLCGLAVLVSASVPLHAAPIIVLAGTDSATVKIIDTANYRPDVALSYRIVHWPDGEVLAEGTVRPEQIVKDEIGYPSFSIRGVRPKLWSPNDPQLYELVLTRRDGILMGKVRFGFRAFEVRNGAFYLNGRPIFLRGLPINPPGRDLPEATGKDPKFVREYLRLLKSAGVNIVRVESELWLSACDEVGLMVFQGQYGPAPGGTGSHPPAFEQCRDDYRRIFTELANHPSVVIYVLTNEVDYKGTSYLELLRKVREDVRRLDPTRPVIGNAGFGRGEPGEIYDVHCYYGWYAHNFHDWYRAYETYLQQAARAGKPLTFTECVGAYTSDDGEFLSMSKQMCTRMRWIGTAPEPRKAALDYQAELLRQVVEIGRRMRKNGRGVAGIMPFTYVLGWSSARSVDDIIIKPAFQALKTAFQPVLLSPECWKRNLFSGDKLQVRLCVVNDNDLGRDLAGCSAVVTLKGPNSEVLATAEVSFPCVPYYSNAWQEVSIKIPESKTRKRCVVECRLLDDTRRVISENCFEITITPRNWARLDGVRVAVFDPVGATAAALKDLGAEVERISKWEHMPKAGLVVVGAKAFSNARAPSRKQLAQFLKEGGRILCLEQEAESWSSDWLPAKYTLVRPRSGFTYIQPVGYNEVIMDELEAQDFRFWNATSRYPDGTPDICPVRSPLRPISVEDLRKARVWASCDQLLSSYAVLELLEGDGSIILCQFGIVERVRHDPIAAKLLANLIRYAKSSDGHKLVSLDKPVRWNQEAFRTGVFVSNLQGLLPHSKTYQHTGSSKGRLGEDHSIDGFTMVGSYHFT